MEFMQGAAAASQQLRVLSDDVNSARCGGQRSRPGTGAWSYLKSHGDVTAAASVNGFI